MMVVIVVIGVLAALLLPRYLGGVDKANPNRKGSPVQQARGTQCANNLSQIRLAIQMSTAAGDEESRPRSLADLRSSGVTDSITTCPVGKVPYRFDPRALRVGCPYPQHQRF